MAFTLRRIPWGVNEPVHGGSHLGRSFQRQRVGGAFDPMELDILTIWDTHCLAVW